MTHERDFDRIAQAWLSVAPNEAPDRVVAAVLEAIETTPQVRRPWRWSAWRQIRMSPRTFAVVGTLLLALVIGGSLLLRENANVAHPSPSPSAVPADVDPSLLAAWAGAPHTTTGIAYAQGSIVRSSFRKDGLWQISGASVPTGLTSSITTTGPGRLTLTVKDSNLTCQKGDVGTYDFVISPGKKRLTLTVENDPCMARSIAAAGDWVRVDCRTGPQIAGGDNDCYGDLEAGTYRSRAVDLRFEILDREPPIVYGGLTFTVPDGWSHVADNATRFWLMPSAEYPRLHDGEALDGLYVFGHPQAASQDEGCPMEAEKGVGVTPAAIMASITSRPSLKTTPPELITINGRPGLWTDIQLDPSWTKSCEWHDGSPIAPILYANTGLSAVDANARERLIVLDIGHGDAVGIEIFAVDAARWDSYVTEAMRIVQSFEFAEPAASN
ncbi:MAG: hypothetical protein ACJ77D_06400 [Chloroflexota bacterium]